MFVCVYLSVCAYIEKEIMTHWRFFYVIKRAVSMEKEEKDERKKNEDKQTNSFPFRRSIESIHPYYYLMDWLVFIVPTERYWIQSCEREREREKMTVVTISRRTHNDFQVVHIPSGKN